MKQPTGRVYVVIGHNDLAYLDAIKKAVLEREGVVSAEVGRLPAFFELTPQKRMMFASSPPRVSPLCKHGVVVLCDNAVTVVGDIVDAASDLRTSELRPGVVLAIGEEILDHLSGRDAQRPPSAHSFPEGLMLESKGVVLDKAPDSRDEALHALCDLARDCGYLKDPEGFESAIKAREQVQTTGVGDGLAFPHAHSDTVAKPFLVMMRSTRGINFVAADGQSVKLVFMIGYPAEKQTHLSALAWLSRRLHDADIRHGLTTVLSPEEAVALLRG